jgi:hypothetical protein
MKQVIVCYNVYIVIRKIVTVILLIKLLVHSDMKMHQA